MPKTSIKQRIRQQYLVHTIIPLLLIILMFGIFIPVGYRQSIRIINQREGRIISENLSLTLQSYQRYARSFSESPVVKNFLLNKEEQLLAKEIFSDFYQFLSKQSIKSSLIVLDGNGTLRLSSSAKEPTFLQILALRDMESRIQKAENKLVGEALQIKFSIEDESVYTYGWAITSEEKTIGYAFLLLDKTDLMHELFARGTSITILVDEFDTVVGTTNSSILQPWNKFRPEGKSDGHHIVGSNMFLINKIPVEHTNLSIYCLSSLNVQAPLINYMILFMALMLSISYLLIRRMSNRIASKTTQPVDRMIQAIEAFQNGDMKAYVHIDSDDEFQVMGEQYNRMLQRINTLIARNTELQEIRRISELKLLESQFNPHFMFNILECIRYMIVLDPKKAETTVLSLSSLLRYSIKEMDQFVLLSEDLQYIHDFLCLHKVRAEGRLNYKIELQPGLEKLFVPRLIIQPLVENSVKYGLLNNLNLSIRITGELDELGKHLIFTVTDDGGGIEESLLKSIQQMIQSKRDHIPRSGIGLYNLYRRIELLYNGEGSLDIHNTKQGLETTVSIPIKRSCNVLGAHR